MPRLSEHERPGAIGMLKAAVRVSDVVRYYNCHPLIIQHLRYCYQGTGTVKGRSRPGQARMATNVNTAPKVAYKDDIYIDAPAGYRQCQTNSRAPRVICFRFLIFFFVLQ